MRYYTVFINKCQVKKDGVVIVSIRIHRIKGFFQDFVLNVIDEVCGWQVLMVWRGIFTSMFFSVIGHTSIESVFVRRHGYYAHELFGDKDP